MTKTKNRKAIDVKNIIILFSSLCIFSSLLFFSVNFTGYSISEFNVENINKIGLSLFIVAIAGFVITRGKK